MIQYFPVKLGVKGNELINYAATNNLVINFKRKVKAEENYIERTT